MVIIPRLARQAAKAGSMPSIVSKSSAGATPSKRSSVAKAWLTSFQKEALGIPGVVAMELLLGCRNHSELDLTRKFLASFNVVWPDSSEFERGCELLISFVCCPGLASRIV